MREYSRNFDKPCPKCGKMTVNCIFEDGIDSIGDSIFGFIHKCSECDYYEGSTHIVWIGQLPLG